MSRARTVRSSGAPATVGNWTQEKPRLWRRCARLLLAALLCACAGHDRSFVQASTAEGIAFSGVAAGDMGTNDAILWTRAFDPQTSQPVEAALLANDGELRKILFAHIGGDRPQTRRHGEDRSCGFLRCGL